METIKSEYKGCLFIVCTPIGNLEDITIRAIRILKESDLILCEDTRKSKNLLNHYNINKSLISYHKFNEKSSIDKILNLLKEKKVSLISDAGTPSISDPGYILIKECVKKNVPIDFIPGATSLINALVLSSFNTENFTFFGFIPKKGKKTLLEKCSKLKETMIFFESPFRIKKIVEELKNYFEPERQIFICKELTKIHETHIRGSIAEVEEKFALNQINTKGEFILVIEGRS